MKKLILFTVGLFVAATTMLIDPIRTIQDGVFSVSTAVAYGRHHGVTRREVRGISRRTARRVHRRHHYYASLPLGCTSIILSAVHYWDCGSIYYQPIVESGKTVYIIVTP